MARKIVFEFRQPQFEGGTGPVGIPIEIIFE
jgi:hypothetical protein